MKRWFWISISVLSIALTGCASPPLVATPLPEARVGVHSFAEMSYLPLSLNDAKTIRFDADTSPVGRFPDGLGVYAAFSIEQQSSVSVLRIRTWASNEWLPLATILKPYVMFLDESKRVISDVESFKGRQGVNFFAGGYKEGYFPIPRTARYFIAYSASSESDRLVLSSANGKLWAIPNAYSGKIEVRQELLPQ